MGLLVRRPHLVDGTSTKLWSRQPLDLECPAHEGTSSQPFLVSRHLFRTVPRAEREANLRAPPKAPRSKSRMDPGLCVAERLNEPALKNCAPQHPTIRATMTSRSGQRRGLWERLLRLWETLMPQDTRKRLQSFPAAFLAIGIAIGMVLMVILFYFFEGAIKSWSGFSPLAFGLLCVYTGIAWFILRLYRRSLEKALGD
jgi:hypothetical protein